MRATHLRNVALPVLAAANLVAAVVIFRQDDFRTMHAWTQAWLHGGTNLYGDTMWATDYPPNAIVTLAPIALLPYGAAAWVWMLGAAVLAVVTPSVAARLVREDAPRGDVALLTLSFLAWSGTRTLLQFSLLAMCLSLVASRLAGRRPLTAGVLLGLALFKPQVALPVCLWMLCTGRWRVLAVSASVVALLACAYCVRADVTPAAVVSGYLRNLESIYAGRERLTGFSELKTLAPEAQADAWGSVILLLLSSTVFATVVAGARRAPAAEAARPQLAALPGTAAAAVLLGFRHMSLAFITLLPAAAFLLLHGDESERARRRPAFWVLQAGLIVDVPTIVRRLQLAGMHLGTFGSAMLHFDRALILGCFLTLVAIQWGAFLRPSRLPSRDSDRALA